MRPDPSATASSSLAATDWSMIRAAIDEGPDADDALDRLVRRYWPALFAYARRSGLDPHLAADRTQAFIGDVVLGRGLLSRADPSRGRFRTLLLSAWRNFLVEQHRHDHRARRRPAGGIAPLPEHEPAHAGDTPEAAYTRSWTAILVREVLEQTRCACMEDGLDAHWRVFEARVVGPMLGGAAAPSYDVLVERLALRDAAHAANMTVTVKRRFARAFLAAIGRTLQDPTDAHAELREILALLEPPR